MKWRFDARAFVVIVCVVYAAVFAWLFTRNLAADTDYSFHMHSIWTFSQGNWIKDPFINGGNWFTLGYGAPAIAFGALLYPLLGVFTVAALLALAFPVLWHYSKRVFERLASKKIAELATFAVLLNPLTVYMFLTAKLPFLWAACFGLMSISFYLQGRGVLAATAGVLAVVTHPVAIFLFCALFLLNLDLRRWLKFYIPAATVFALQLLTVFRLGIGGGSTPIFYTATVLLGIALAALFLARRESRIPCTFAFVLLIGSLIACLFGVSISTVYFDRIAWFVFVLSLPFLIARAAPHLGKLIPGATTFALVFSAALICFHAVSVYDNPLVYRELPSEVRQELENDYVRYATDGSALYELPKFNVRFSNAGQEVFEGELFVDHVENAATYRVQIEMENDSYILVYGQSPEENFIRELNYALIYSADNLKIYRTHLVSHLT
ncbi:MAG: hypothetical protein COT21_00100 [Hadesarchaea archaeon CG08_land_8_20_14_0_20_51_8]|nr:MAG: hypothetical protein COT21_00100 [Hadesarchaea archaeon CG08_land_8_20_14_0_20_51_8]